MKKTLSILLILTFVLSLAACSSEPDPNEGVYVGKTASMSGFTLDVEKVFEGGMTIELKSGGRAVLRTGGEDYNVKWALDGTKFTLTASDSEYTGTLSDGVLTLENILDSGMDMTLEKSN